MSSTAAHTEDGSPSTQDPSFQPPPRPSQCLGDVESDSDEDSDKDCDSDDLNLQQTDSDDSSPEGSPARRQTNRRALQTSTKEVLRMLEAHLADVARLEDAKLQMEREHMAERDRLQDAMEQMVESFLNQRHDLEEKVQSANNELAMLELEKAQAKKQVLEMRKLRDATEKHMADERIVLQAKHEEAKHALDVMLREKEYKEQQLSDVKSECDRLALEREEMQQAVIRLHAEADEKLEALQRAMDMETSQFNDRFQRVKRDHQEELDYKSREMESERERIASERRDLGKKLVEFREDCDRRMQEEEARMSEKMEDFRKQNEQALAEAMAKAELQKEELELRVRAEHERAEAEMETMRLELEQQMEKEKLDMQNKMTLMVEEKKRMEADREETITELGKLRKDCQYMVSDRDRLEQQAQALRSEMVVKERELLETNERIKAEAQANLLKVAADSEKKLAELRKKHEAEVEEKTMELHRERARLTEERAKMVRQMEAEFKKQQEEASRKMTDLKERCERDIEEQRSSTEARLTEMRAQTEAQIQMEKEVTEHVKVVLRELPPLQAAMELGDLPLLEDELWKWRGEELPERFGDCKGVVSAILSLAKERLLTWRSVDHTQKDILREVESLPPSNSVLTQQCQRLLRVLKEAQLTRMDLRRSDPSAIEKACKVLQAWQGRTMTTTNRVHKLIINKTITWPDLGPFDFSDLDICLRLVDRSAESDEVFLSRIQALVEDPNTAPKDFRGLFSHVETMLFFLKYAKMEDLQRTYAEFKKQLPKLNPIVARFLAAAEQDYRPGFEVAKFSHETNLLSNDSVSSVLADIRSPRTKGGDGLGVFREIFYQWALAMQSKFNLLVLPHHTQVVCLMIFKHFFEHIRQQDEKAPEARLSGTTVVQRCAHTLIAQVGTGEGKSMIVASLAIFVVVALGKKAHVVVDDETLLERDYWTFKPLFDTFKVALAAEAKQNGLNGLNSNGGLNGKNGHGHSNGGNGISFPVDINGGNGGFDMGDDKGGYRSLRTKLCVSEERMAAAGPKSDWLAVRVDRDADICYCEAKHVQSFYASIARSEHRDFDSYSDRVLILDEVDALVIDEEPNEVFVYPNTELSELATKVAEALKTKVAPYCQEEVHNSEHPGRNRVVNYVTQEWEKAKKLVVGEEIVFSKDLGRFCTLKSGRANTAAWSLALECRNFQDGFSREILFQERLFVMSRPRVFRKYYAIVGLSGSIGSEPERNFLQDTYGAMFFEVPPFLKTCRSELNVFHEAVPAPFGSEKRQVYVEGNAEAQMHRIAEVALEARERVPVLIIGKDRAFCEQLVEYLHQAARSQGLGRIASDVIRSLSRTLYESDPEQWKENLNRATMPVGSSLEEGSGCGKSFRITVTDPRGGRGTDYRVDDSDVDAYGGLLLVPSFVPPSRRDWIQFLGRTARQDRRGQYCAILCAPDYDASANKYGGQLDRGSTNTIESILCWGDLDAAARVQASAALYNNGVRMNELCEYVFHKMPEILHERSSRELLVDCCQRHRWMNLQEVDKAFARIHKFRPQEIPTEAKDMGRPAEPPVAGAAAPVTTTQMAMAPLTTTYGLSGMRSNGGQSILTASSGESGQALDYQFTEPPRTVIFCLDCSVSMQSKDTRTPLSRFELCVRSILQILQNQVRDIDEVSVVCFGSVVAEIFPPMPKGKSRAMMHDKICRLQTDPRGGTCFYDAVLACLHTLELSSGSGGKWLICLTDGDDVGSRTDNNRGQRVSQFLETHPISLLNMVMITVGSLQAQNSQTIGSFVSQVQTMGGQGQLVAAQDAGKIEMAFQVVAECLEAELGGATEC